jgi:hypothetical protein
MAGIAYQPSKKRLPFPIGLVNNILASKFDDVESLENDWIFAY